MSGYHAVSVLADAITKGVFSNVDEALAAMVSTSTVPYYEGIADYMKLGYIPLDKVVQQPLLLWSMHTTIGLSIRQL